MQQAVELIDSGRYPLHDPTLAGYAAAVDRAAGEWEEDGWCALPGFVAGETLDAMRAEVAELAPLAAGSPSRVITYDLFAADSLFRLLYRSEALAEFVAAVTGSGQLFRPDDPLGALTLYGVAGVSGETVVRSAGGKRGRGDMERIVAELVVDSSSEAIPGTLWVGDARRVETAGPVEGVTVRMTFVRRADVRPGDAEQIRRFGRLAAPRRRGR